MPRDFQAFAADPEGEQEQAPAAAGAALVELVRRDLFPGFALGPWYDALKAAGKGAALPEQLAFIAEDAILLAPFRLDATTWGGYLIAMDEAAGQPRQFTDEDGQRLVLVVPPEIGGSEPVEAVPQARLPIAGSPAWPG